MCASLTLSTMRCRSSERCARVCPLCGMRLAFWHGPEGLKGCFKKVDLCRKECSLCLHEGACACIVGSFVRVARCMPVLCAGVMRGVDLPCNMVVWFVLPCLTSYMCFPAAGHHVCLKAGLQASNTPNSLVSDVPACENHADSNLRDFGQ